MESQESDLDLADNMEDGNLYTLEELYAAAGLRCDERSLSLDAENVADSNTTSGRVDNMLSSGITSEIFKVGLIHTGEQEINSAQKLDITSRDGTNDLSMSAKFSGNSNTSKVCDELLIEQGPAPATSINNAISSWSVPSYNTCQLELLDPCNDAEDFEEISHNKTTIDVISGDAEFCGNWNDIRKRRKKSQKKTWDVEVQKTKRMKGESYLGYERPQLPAANQKRKLNKEKPPRVMKPGCKSIKCINSALRNCDSFSEEDRSKIFKSFWLEMDWGQKRAFVLSLVDKISKKRNTKKEGKSRRTETLVYYLKLDNQKSQVCRTMFVNTLGLGKNHVLEWVKGGQVSRKPRSSGNQQIPSSKDILIREFLEQLPKLPSHYCRQSSSKLYLEPIFSTKSHLYKVYQEFCKTKEPHASIFKFLSVLDSLNIALYKPKKDKCDTCCGHEVGNISEAEWSVHIEKKNIAREEKATDKKNALNGLVHVVVMDMEAVKNAPMLNASALYYKTKLIVHNFTVYDMATKTAKCYLWDESEGEMVASVFASCLVDFLEDKYDDDLPIIIWSDGCTNQNRNAMLSTALLDLSIRKNKTILQKYLEKGHTQMEVDSVHSAIECKMKNKVIYLPTDYIKICVDARENPKPYEVQYVDHTFFKNYTLSQRQWYPSIRPGTKKGDPCVTDMRSIKFNPDGTIYYKLGFKSDWKPLPRTPQVVPVSQFPNLYKNRLPIPKRKYQDLQDLLCVIPEDHHTFYKSLPVVE